MAETLVIVCLAGLTIFLGVALIRVGMIGPFLGRWRMVSFVKKYPDQPKLYHRWLTAGIGIVSILLGIGMTFLQLIVFPRMK
jgi:hypothetical protein